MRELVSAEEPYGSEQQLLSGALVALRETAGIHGTAVQLHPQVRADYRADASVDLVCDGQTHRYMVECKTNVDRKAQIDQIDLKLRQADARTMLVTDYLSKELAAHCRTVGLQFIDTHGNAYLSGPGLFVLTAGEKNERRRLSSKAPKGLTNQAALRVVFALLSKPACIGATFQEIAALSNVALGTAHNVLGDLTRRGYLIAGSKHARKLLERQRLVDEWATNFPTTLRTKLNSRRFSSPDPYWWQHADIADFDAVWGSEVAAAKMVKHLKPSTQTLYVEPTGMSSLITMLVKKMRLRPDPDGPIEILEKFWSPLIDVERGLAPPLLVYSDLLALLDPRAAETADMIRESVIESASHPG